MLNGMPAAKERTAQATKVATNGMAQSCKCAMCAHGSVHTDVNAMPLLLCKLASNRSACVRRMLSI